MPFSALKQELFVTEYRLMLADKLVNNLAYDTDKEVQNLELLKLRFGESSMHQCEIMVKKKKMVNIIKDINILTIYLILQDQNQN